MRSLYGSLSHSVLADLVSYGEVDLDGLPDRLSQYFADRHFIITEKEFMGMAEEIQRDMISVMNWVEVHKVRFVFIEFPVWSDTDQLATQIDIGCFCVDWFDDFYVEGEKKGKNAGDKKREKVEKEIFALVDYKTTASGFRLEHRYQLESCRTMFKECYPEFTDLNIELYNLRGSKWKNTKWVSDKRSSPFSFVRQTDRVDIDRYNALLALARNTREKRLMKPITHINGVARLGDSASNFVKSMTIHEIVESGQWKTYLKDNPITSLL